MKFLKQAKIKAKQAKNWMRVCHRAMELFPGYFNYVPIDSAALIIELLEELNERQAIEAKVIRTEAVVLDEQSQFKPEMVNELMMNRETAVWLGAVKRDPTTHKPICDVCGVVMQTTDPAGSAQWIDFHYGHPRRDPEEYYVYSEPHMRGTRWWVRKKDSDFKKSFGVGDGAKAQAEEWAENAPAYLEISERVKADIPIRAVGQSLMDDSKIYTVPDADTCYCGNCTPNQLLMCPQHPASTTSSVMT